MLEIKHRSHLTSQPQMSASQRHLQWGFWKVWIKSSRISSRRQITEKCLFANTNWISIMTALQLMHFCCIGDWCVCVWCLRIAGRHILCLEHDLEGLASRVCSQGPVISFERYHCECHGNFSFGRGSEGAVWTGGISRSLQRLSWGGLRLDYNPGKGPVKHHPWICFCLLLHEVSLWIGSKY